MKLINLRRSSSDENAAAQDQDGIFAVGGDSYGSVVTLSKARRHWRIKAIGNHTINVMSPVTLAREDGSDSDGNDIPAVFAASSPFLSQQWAADLLIEANAFGILEKPDSRRTQRIQYAHPAYVTILHWRGVLQGYEIAQQLTQTGIARNVGGGAGLNIVERRLSGSRGEYAPEDVIHIKNGLDPYYGELLGDNRLRYILGMLQTDDELNSYTLDLVRNAASTSMIMQPKGTQGFNMIKQYGRQLREALRRHRRGGIAIIPAEVDIVTNVKNPRDLQFDSLHRIPESAIASVLNINPVLVKWMTGTERMTYNNVAEMKTYEQQELVYPLASIIEDGINDRFFGSEFQERIVMTVPKLWTLDDLVRLREAGLHEAAAEVAGTLGLPYSGGVEPQEGEESNG